MENVESGGGEENEKEREESSKNHNLHTLTREERLCKISQSKKKGREDF